MEDWFEWSEFLGEGDDKLAALTDAAQRLARRRSMLWQLFERCPIGLFSIENSSGKFVRVNAEFCRITGYTREEALNLSYLDVVAPEDTERVADYRRRRILGDPTIPATYEMLIRHRSGDRKVVVFSANVIRLADHIFASLRDITAERLMLDPIFQSQKMDSLALLAGGLANEFNNLLSAISGHAQLALPRVEHLPDVVDSLQRIRQAVSSATTHVESLLAFSRRSTNVMESVDPGAVVAALPQVLPSFVTRDVTIHFAGLQDSGPVRGDAARLEQAFFNILVNAAEAASLSPSPEVLIRIERSPLPARLQSELGPGTYLVLHFQDNGPGIPLENMGRIFQPFFTTKDNRSHPGLGLPTAYGILKDHAGFLEVRSGLGEGTTFSAWLPLDTDPSLLVPATVEPPQHAHEAAILVVDDQEIVAELICDILNGSGYDARYITSSVQALEAISAGTEKPDLLILDLMMPRMDGREFIRQLDIVRFSGPIIVTSGYSTPADDDVRLKSRTSGFLRKPFEKDRLLALVAAALDRGFPDPALPPTDRETR
ncbi:MAG: response regulator [Deltaproteobacteria bacterium]|nr:response regulator [Deltaproteobacteria bacterium]